MSWLRQGSRALGRRDALALALLLGWTAALVGPYLVTCFTGSVPGGWDGTAHYGVAELYAERIFPSVSGWLPEYFAGMPFPDFYPPGFYFAVALLTRLGLSTAAAFWLVQGLATAALPVLVYLCTRQLTGRRGSALVAGLLAALYLMDARVGITGISVVGTFGIGLSTQLLAACFLLACYLFLLRAEDSLAAALWSALFLALVALTNVHMVWVAVALYVPLVACRVVGAPKRRVAAQRLGRYLGIGALAVALSSVWVLPMLGDLALLPTSGAQRLPGMIGTRPFWVIGACALVAGVAGGRAHSSRLVALAISAAGLAFVAAFPWWRLDSEFPLQFFRAGSSAGLLACMLLGALVRSTGTRWNRIAAAALASVGTVALCWDVAPRQRPNGPVPAERARQYRAVLEVLAGRTDGRVLVENGQADPLVGQRPEAADGEPFGVWRERWQQLELADMFAMQGLVGATGSYSMTTVFREASLNALFAIPLRNGFSRFPEGFGVDGKLHGTASFTWSRPLTSYEPQLRAFNIRYLVVRSAIMKAYLREQPGVRRESPVGEWELHALASPWGYAEVPRFQPMLVFAPFSVKQRADYGFDFIRLGEEMFGQGRLSVPLALSRTATLDREPELDRFGGVVITEYAYGDLERAYAILETLSRTRPVIALAADDALFTRLRELAPARPTIRLVERPPWDRADPPPYSEWLAARRIITEMLDAIEDAAVPVGDAPRVEQAILAGDRTTVALSDVPTRPVPVLIKQTYFPRWSNRSGAPIYLASPAMQLTFTDRAEIELRYGGGRQVGGWISLLALLGWALGLGIALRRRRSAHV